MTLMDAVTGPPPGRPRERGGGQLPHVFNCSLKTPGPIPLVSVASITPALTDHAWLQSVRFGYFTSKVGTNKEVPLQHAGTEPLIPLAGGIRAG